MPIARSDLHGLRQGAPGCLDARWRIVRGSRLGDRSPDADARRERVSRCIRGTDTQGDTATKRSKRPQPVFSYLRRAKRSWKQLLVERRLAGSNPTLTPGAVTMGDCRVSSGFWEGHDAVGRAFLLLFLRSSFAEFLQ